MTTIKLILIIYLFITTESTDSATDINIDIIRLSYNLIIFLLTNSLFNYLYIYRFREFNFYRIQMIMKIGNQDMFYYYGYVYCV